MVVLGTQMSGAALGSLSITQCVARSHPSPRALAGYHGDHFPAERPPRWPGMLGKLKSSRGKVSMATAKKKKSTFLHLGVKAVICMQAGARRL